MRGWDLVSLIPTNQNPLSMALKHLLHTLPLLLVAPMASAQILNYNVGETVADFTVTDTEGNVHNLYTYTAQGKHVVLDFFFDTCPPCQQTQPYYNQLHEAYGCNGHDLVTISVNNGTDTNAEVDAFEATYGGPWNHAPAIGIEGGCAAVDDDFGIAAYPTYCLIGPDNKLKSGDIWPISSMTSFVNAFPAGSNIEEAACIVGIAENRATTVQSIFPTPTTGAITVEFTLATAGDLAIEVIDALGRATFSERLGQRPTGTFVHTMDLAQLSNGNYTLRFAMDGVATGTARLSVMH